MNKTLITLGIGIWAIMLLLNFILRGSFVAVLTCDELTATLLLLTIIEIFAFILAIVGLFRSS